MADAATRWEITPVDQTSFGNPSGDCFSACVATITGIPRPEFDEAHRIGAEGDGSWWNEYQRVLRAHGWGGMIYFAHGEPDTYFPEGWSIAGGPSPRAEDGDDHPGHAVVCYDGQMVHDPHPSRAGLSGPVDTWYILLRPRE